MRLYPVVFKAATKEQIARRPNPMRPNFTWSVTIDLERVHSINLENELARFLGNEARVAMDQLAIDFLV
jgi:hypothetical protein